MAVNSVGASFTAIQQLQQSTIAKQPEATERPPENESTANAATASEASVAGGQSAAAERSSRPERPESQTPPQPVVNAQGQKTGTIINTTA